jgi:DNA-directed RNA polymerase I, II, and III subunit RPABC5
MLIPVKCFTCGKVIGNMYDYYINEVKRRKGLVKNNSEEIQYLDENNIEKTAHGIILDELHMKDMCCRRHFLTHVNIF